MSKWSREALRALEPHAFWVVGAISFIVSKPWQLFRAFLQSHELLVRRTGGGALAHLVWGKADEFWEMMLELTQVESWAAFLADEVGDELLMEAAAVCREISMASLIEYNVRTLSRTEAFPAKLLLLGKNKPTVPCKDRQAIAPEMLKSDIDKLEMNAAKLVAIASQGLQTCSRTGLLDPKVYAWISNLCRIWRPDTEAQE